MCGNTSSGSSGGGLTMIVDGDDIPAARLTYSVSNIPGGYLDCQLHNCGIMAYACPSITYSGTVDLKFIGAEGGANCFRWGTVPNVRIPDLPLTHRCGRAAQAPFNQPPNWNPCPPNQYECDCEDSTIPGAWGLAFSVNPCRRVVARNGQQFDLTPFVSSNAQWAIEDPNPPPPPFDYCSQLGNGKIGLNSCQYPFGNYSPLIEPAQFTCFPGGGFMATGKYWGLDCNANLVQTGTFMVTTI